MSTLIGMDQRKKCQSHKMSNISRCRHQSNINFLFFHILDCIGLDTRDEHKTYTHTLKSFFSKTFASFRSYNSKENEKIDIVKFTTKRPVLNLANVF